MNFRKRLFDLVVTVIGSAIWVPTILVSAIAIVTLSGFPIFYVSVRRVGHSSLKRVIKFRTMVRNAEQVFNRETVPVSGNVRFLNTPPDSPLYTPIGRLIERCALTEIPQFWLVLTGDMSIVGNRPLPDNVMNLLREIHPTVDDRFITPAGMTGPVQLIGRSSISDEDRLMLEADYCRIASATGSWGLDLTILIYTILVATGILRSRTVGEVSELMHAYARSPRGVSGER